jgi:hypothetical protein
MAGRNGPPAPRLASRVEGATPLRWLYQREKALRLA